MKNRPLALYECVRVTSGPLWGYHGIIHEVHDDGILIVLLNDEKQSLLPPLPFRKDQLAAGLPYLPQRLFCAVICGAAGVYWLAVRSTMSTLLLGAALFVWLAFIVYLGLHSRHSKTCPQCGDKLDENTSYSTCPACNWVRTFPPRASEHLAEFERVNPSTGD